MPEWEVPLFPVEPPPGIPNPDAFRVGQLAGYLFGSHLAQLAAFLVARDPKAPDLLPPRRPGQRVPVGRVPERAGEGHMFHLPYYLDWARNMPPEEFERAALGVALITLGGELADHGYFDHAPELELVRHLRNGVAHGNRFNIDGRGRKQLTQYPAHNRLVQATSQFEVTSSVHGREVLFDFMESGDVLSLIQAVSGYLIRMGNGDPLRP